MYIKGLTFSGVIYLMRFWLDVLFVQGLLLSTGKLKVIPACNIICIQVHYRLKKHVLVRVFRKVMDKILHLHPLSKSCSQSSSFY